MKRVIQEMFIFNLNGTYSRKMSREDDIRMESENRGFYNGFDKGEASGIVKGEKREQEKIAKTMIEKGMKAKDISEITKLALKKIKTMML